MSTALSLGRKEPDKQTVGGFKAAYFIEYASDTFSGATIVAGEVTGFGSVLALYKYELKGANSFDETPLGGRESGTVAFEGSGTFQFKKQSLAAQNEIKLMAFDRKHVILEDYNGNFKIIGFECGVEISVGTASGTNMEDFTGFNITVSTKEKDLAHYVASSIIDDTINTNVTEGA